MCIRDSAKGAACVGGGAAAGTVVAGLALGQTFQRNGGVLRLGQQLVAGHGAMQFGTRQQALFGQQHGQGPGLLGAGAVGQPDLGQRRAVQAGGSRLTQQARFLPAGVS